MPRRINQTPTTVNAETYYQALQQLVQLQAAVLDRVLPHYGERGANDEERVREFLSRVLPRKFSTGSGFVICSDRSVAPSSQTDIVIYDDIQNSPLFRELSAFVFPIEMVYGIVEVKGKLRRSHLRKIMADIAKIREMAKRRSYVRYASVPKDPQRPTERVARPVDDGNHGAPPRSFVFAYSAADWTDIQSLARSLTRAAKAMPAHIHGLVVLDKDWYLAQEAFAKEGPRFYTYTDNALMRFVTGMISSLSSVHMAPASVTKYLRMES